jgi:GTP-binding protein HflX
LAKKKELPEIEDLISESQQVAAEFDSEIFIPDSFQSTQQDLSDRQALRRVIGLSTELSDISEAEYRQLRLERVILVGVWTEGSVKDAENSMEELAALAETAGSTVLDALIQRRDKPDPATFIGSGKVSELKAIVKSTGADTVVCDG